MFNNIGSKCKTVAKVSCWIGIIASVIGGIAMIAAGANSWNGGALIFGGIVTMLIGSLLSWIGSLGLFALGEITENSDIRTNLAIKADVERKQDI